MPTLLPGLAQATPRQLKAKVKSTGGFSATIGAAIDLRHGAPPGRNQQRFLLLDFRLAFCMIFPSCHRFLPGALIPIVAGQKLF